MLFIGIVTLRVEELASAFVPTPRTTVKDLEGQDDPAHQLMLKVCATSNQPARCFGLPFLEPPCLAAASCSGQRKLQIFHVQSKHLSSILSRNFSPTDSRHNTAMEQKNKQTPVSSKKKSFSIYYCPLRSISGSHIAAGSISRKAPPLPVRYSCAPICPSSLAEHSPATGPHALASPFSPNRCHRHSERRNTRCRTPGHWSRLSCRHCSSSSARAVRD
ncbi:hypothetical protein B0H67DRAFT_144005 [Lasiosphaeris hirsuta]|uniref:Uncharacterized protein n=1 Tax=Lasiosphaeris hirsuta TaxID=260670 RepID=A0AA40E3Q5_9PEZI|nr:hypothetical protein B0H67DRAFT_144005 [Lasiosphaeris hirsuta]